VTRRAPVLVKLGGELLEGAADRARVARGLAALARRAPVVVVHGGGRDIDTAMEAAGIARTQVDGIRVTDEDTLDVVVAVLAGTVNTRLVAALRAASAQPVGLTAADAGVALVRRAAPMTAVSGRRVDLGLVGTPAGGAPRLLTDLLARKYLPVVACIGGTSRGQILNVNADTLAAHLAGTLGASRLAILGGTAGVFDAGGATIRRLRAAEAARLIRAGTANRGMVAKLQACRAALARGVGDVVIADGRTVPFAALAGRIPAATPCTQVVA
jgi:acetylglutamate kinase